MTVPADPELLLAAACCRWPPSPARDAAVRAAAHAVDWQRFGRVVIRQRIAGLVDAALRAAAITPTHGIAEKISRQAMRVMQQNMLATRDTALVMQAIAAAGYPVLAVKGVVLGALAYGTIGLKHSKDIDLLILPEHVEPVLTLLETLDYQLLEPAERLSPAQRRILTRHGKDITLGRRNAGRSVQVELHWRLFDNPWLLPELSAQSPSQDVALGHGLTVPTLAASDLYAYLVLHGAIDGWSRMKWLADVNALLAGRDPSALRELHASAFTRDAGVGAASAQALVMAHELFGLPLAADFLAELQSTKRIRMLITGAYRLMAVRDGATEIGVWRGGQMLSLAMQFLLGHGPHYHAQILRSVLYTRSAMYRSSIPPALYPLYPVVRIPSWVTQRLVGLVRWPFERGKSATIAAKSP